MIASRFASAASGSETAMAVSRGDFMQFKVRMGCARSERLIASGAKAQFLQFTPVGGPESRPETARDRLKRASSRRSLRHRAGARRAADRPPRHSLRAEPLRLRWRARIGPHRDRQRRLPRLSADRPQGDLDRPGSPRIRLVGRPGERAAWTSPTAWRPSPCCNRSTIDVAAGRIEQQRLLTPEIPQLVNAATGLAGLRRSSGRL